MRRKKIFISASPLCASIILTGFTNLSRLIDSPRKPLESYQFPKNGIPDRSVYQTVGCNGHKPVMLVHPSQDNAFYVRVFIENHSLFDDKVEKKHPCLLLN